MSAALPEAVEAYLQAKFDENADGLAALFAEDAVVHDENRDHAGRAAIRDWAAGVSAAYDITRTVTGTTVHGPAALVRVRVAGNFPGSPVDLHHHFTVADDRIAALTICP
ncbi:hypothetical protein BJF78_11275 [Pseudonocardia sp. CNS-139]|nr:hypothetical protein BJF78_11275 [Pseudonocardia sp. CNS-139]